MTSPSELQETRCEKRDKTTTTIDDPDPVFIDYESYFEIP